MGDEPCRIDYDNIEVTTDDAILITIDLEKFWVPRSQILDEMDDDFPVSDGPGWLEIPEWPALEKGLI